MPLTPAHAAAALPLRWAARRARLALPLSALVIGSMSPDFEYLLRMRPRGEVGHTAIGLVVFCLPVGLAVWAVFRGVVAPALLALLPPGLAGAIDAGRTRAPWPLLGALAAVAVLLGAASHDLWDSFTHGSGWFVVHVPALQSSVMSDTLPGLRWYRLIQHASTVLGLAVLAVAVWRWARAQPAGAHRFAPGQASRSLRWAAVFLALATLGAAVNGFRGRHEGRLRAAGYAAVGGMATLAVGLLAFGFTARVQRPITGFGDETGPPAARAVPEARPEL